MNRHLGLKLTIYSVLGIYLFKILKHLFTKLHTFYRKGCWGMAWNEIQKSKQMALNMIENIFLPIFGKTFIWLVVFSYTNFSNRETSKFATVIFVRLYFTCCCNPFCRAKFPFQRTQCFFFDEAAVLADSRSLWSCEAATGTSGRSNVDCHSSLLQCSQQICLFSKLILLVFKMDSYWCWRALSMGIL